MTSSDSVAALLTMLAAEAQLYHRAKSFSTVDFVHTQAVPIAVRRQTKLPQPALGRCPGMEASSSPALSFQCCAAACWESRSHCWPVKKALMALAVGTCVPSYTGLTGLHNLQNRRRTERKRWPKRSARAGLTEGKTLQSWRRGGGTAPPHWAGPAPRRPSTCTRAPFYGSQEERRGCVCVFITAVPIPKLFAWRTCATKGPLRTSAPSQGRSCKPLPRERENSSTVVR